MTMKIHIIPVIFFLSASIQAQEAPFMFPVPKPIEQTWIESEGKVYGAAPDELGPIGGGEGYTRILTDGNYRVTRLEELREALEKAQPGEVVFIDGGVKIDCTTLVYIEELVLELGEGVTLASDRGHEGSSGAILMSGTFKTLPLIRVTGPNARITGLRIYGPDPERRLDHHRRSYSEGRGKEYYYQFPISRGISCDSDGLEVDNCELAGWSHAAIFLKVSREHRVHHSYIHHNQRQGLGYGVCLDVGEALIESNLFDWNRHSIAATGRPGTSYEAANNVEMGTSLSHCFDMHGGEDRGDGTQIAGTWMRIRHNTFFAPQTPIVIRGIPEENCSVTRNWFPNHSEPGTGKEKPAGIFRRNTVFEDNRYGQ